jgi:hypothetical protein
MAEAAPDIRVKRIYDPPPYIDFIDVFGCMSANVYALLLVDGVKPVR